MSEQLYINDEKFGSVTYVGTWEEWRNGMVGSFRTWYAEYSNDLADKLHHQEIEEEDATPMEYDTWVRETMNKCLTEVDEKEAIEYERLVNLMDVKNESEPPHMGM